MNQPNKTRRHMILRVLFSEGGNYKVEQRKKKCNSENMIPYLILLKSLILTSSFKYKCFNFIFTKLITVIY